MFESKKDKKVNYLWNLGNVWKLKEYYRANQEAFQNSEGKNFYADFGNDVDRIIHSGMPASISETIIDLIGIDGLDIVVENDDEKIKQELWDFYDANDLLDKFEKVINDLTWSGEAFYKLVGKDKNVSVEIINPLNVETNKVSGKVISYKFLIDENEENTLRTSEIYGVGYIKRIVEEKVSLGRNKGDEWVIKDESLFYTNTNFILAGEITIPRDAYSKNLQMFDSLDETLSRMPDEQRKGKMQRFIDETLIPKDDKGNLKGETSAAVKDWIKVAGSRSEESEKLIEFVMADIDPEKRYLKTLKAYEKLIIRNAGLSYHTYAGGEIGGNGLSAESQRELEKLSIRTRKRYINRLKPFITDLFNKYLFLLNTGLEIKMAEIGKDKNYIESDLQLQDLDNNISIIFNDYITNSLDARIKLWGGQEAQATFPLKFRIAKILEDELEEKEVEELAEKLNIENGNGPLVEEGEE